MGGPSDKTQLVNASRALRAACGRAVVAQARLHEYGVALGWPQGERRPPEWGRTEVGLVLELHAAIGELITCRREYDRLAREMGHGMFGRRNVSS